MFVTVFSSSEHPPLIFLKYTMHLISLPVNNQSPISVTGSRHRDPRLTYQYTLYAVVRRIPHLTGKSPGSGDSDVID